MIQDSGMEPYLLEGLVHPERAQIQLHFQIRFTHLSTRIDATAVVSVILNQVAVWVNADIEWDIFDLRNVVKEILQNELAIVGYLTGHSYEVEIKRILHRGRNIDYVYGIDIPYIKERNKDVDINAKIASIRKKTIGESGILLHRCFNDLVMAMKNPTDTGFYCYRAIESLRHHCREKYEIDRENRIEQWKKFRECTHCDEATILYIKNSADPLRHGEVTHVTSSGRVELFKKTWDIVDNYLQHLSSS
jgi:hypothetical protein